MIITLIGADFSDSNIGTLSTYSIRFNSNGITNANTSVDRETNTGYIATITFKENYELNGAITVTMGGVDITSTAVSGLNINITKVTGNVVITVPAKSTVVEPEEPETPVTPTNYTFTINPTPTSATVTLTASGYTQSGNSITVPNGTTVTWSVSADGYTTKTGTYVMTASNYTLPVILIAEGESGTTTLTPNGNAKTYVVKKDGNTMSGASFGNLEYDLTAGQGGTINITTTYEAPAATQWVDVVVWALFSGTVGTDTILTPVGPDIHDNVYTATIDMNQYPTATKLRVFGIKATMKDTTVVTHTS